VISRNGPLTYGDEPPDDLGEKYGPSSGSEVDRSRKEGAGIELSREMFEELLDPEGWTEVLSSYARTVGLAVALTNCEGHQSGPCHNAQLAWKMGNAARLSDEAGSKTRCSFCLDSSPPCRGVTTALSTGAVELVRDRVGMVHLAVPLSLGGRPLGAIVAGQVFDRYPEPLPLERFARSSGISTQPFWHLTRKQAPIRNATLHVYGELLLSLGIAFLRQRYAAILDRKLAKASLRFRLLLDGIRGYAFFTVDGTGSVTSWNRGAERIFGHRGDEVVGRHFSLFFTPEDIRTDAHGKLLLQAQREGSANDQRWQVRKDGTRFFAEGSLTALGEGRSREFGRLSHDVTDRLNAEEALRETQKLESIGLLASGIAHDFNNLLGGVLANSELALMGLTEGSNPAEELLKIRGAAIRGAEIVRQLMVYVGEETEVLELVDIAAIVKDMLELLKVSVSKHVTVETDLGGRLRAVRANSSQIRQIVMNLFHNASEAIGDQDGVVRVTTRDVTVTPDSRLAIS